MRRPVRAAAAVILLAAFALRTADGRAGETRPVSGNANASTPATSVADASSPAMSLDGRCVAFSSDASNLVPGDTNGASDVFVRRLPNGPIRRVSVTARGRQANAASHSPSLSVDCRHVAFVSRATNLVRDRNGVEDVFLKDLSSGSVRLVSLTQNEQQANGPSSRPFVSLFGRYVTFESEATNLSKGDANDRGDAFLRDVAAGGTARIVPPAAETAGEIAWTKSPQVSYDGRFVTFTRATSRTLSADPTALDVFVLDRRRKTVSRIPVSPWAGRARAMTDNAALSADGRYVAFEAWSAIDNDNTLNGTSPADNDDALARNPFDHKDIYLWDQQSRSFGYISANTGGTLGNADSWGPAISANGHVVAFASTADNLVPGDTNGVADVFVRDLAARTTSRMSIGAGQQEPNGSSDRPSMSYEGRNIVFASQATNLVGPDANAARDVFWHDRRTDTPNRAPVLSVPIKGTRIVNIGEEVRFRLRARDPDRDALRFGNWVSPRGEGAMPEGARLDTAEGDFLWRPEVVHGGRTYTIFFWVGDPRGFAAFAAVTITVRDAEQTTRCELFGQCST